MSQYPPMMPVTFPPWVSVSPQQNLPNFLPGAEPPARIRLALEYLSFIHARTMTRAAVNDISIEQVEGQKLSHAESNARESACNMLSDYFNGKLSPDYWERAQMRGYNKSITEDKNTIPRGEGSAMNCLACPVNGPPKPSCRMCKGTGHVIIFPMFGDD